MPMMMKHLLTILCIPALLLLSSAEGWSLPACEGSNDLTWTSCFGTETLPDGTQYVGEYRDGKPHGKGTLTASDGRAKKGMWRNGELLE